MAIKNHFYSENKGCLTIFSGKTSTSSVVYPILKYIPWLEIIFIYMWCAVSRWKIELHNTQTHTIILTYIMYCICWLFKSLLMYWTYCIWWQSFDTCQSTFAFIFGFHLNRFDLTWFDLIRFDCTRFPIGFPFGCSLNAFSIYAFSLASAVVIVVLARF